MSGLPRTNFELITSLPGSKDEQHALLVTLTQALDELPGPWRVGACRGTAVSWIILSIFRDDGFECSLFLDEPIKQTPLFIREQLVQALRLQVVESPRAMSVKKSV